MGPAADIYRIVTSGPIQDTDDDQLFYTNVFLNPSFRVREQLKIMCPVWY